MRILVAEDEKNLNRLIVSRLTEEHYSVDACFDGGEAMAYLESAEYDAVVLDIMMPVMDGLAVLKKDAGEGDEHTGSSADCTGQHRGSGSGTGCGSQRLFDQALRF